VVATPIGNLEDITLRALRVLKEVKLIAAEDTRTVRHLLDRYDIRTPVTSYYEHNKLMKLESLLDFMATEGPVALVSEAGMPGISDPGYELVKAAIEAGEKVVPIPGPSAVITALAASGLPTQDFTFLGFLPRQSGDRKKLLKAVANETRTLVCFEAPHRLREALADCFYTLGDRPPCGGTRDDQAPRGNLPRYPFPGDGAFPRAAGRVHPGHRGGIPLGTQVDR
jgi:16S rRNA (cytidine1402-2'-O)-methyltransferase